MTAGVQQFKATGSAKIRTLSSLYNVQNVLTVPVGMGTEPHALMFGVIYMETHWRWEWNPADELHGYLCVQLA